MVKIIFFKHTYGAHFDQIWATLHILILICGNFGFTAIVNENGLRLAKNDPLGTQYK